MKLEEHLQSHSSTDQAMFQNRIQMLPNASAFMEETRLPAQAWATLVSNVLSIQDPVQVSQLRSAIQTALRPYILEGPAASPAPAFLERVGNARVAVFAQKYSGLTNDEIEKDWDDFSRLVANHDLGGIKSKFRALLIGKRPVWGCPFRDLAARPFAGIGIADLCKRLALGRGPAPDGNDWVFCYAAPSSPPPKVPTVADACGGKSWHEPFFPAPRGMSQGLTKPAIPSIPPFFEVVHDELSWESLVALPERRKV